MGFLRKSENSNYDLLSAYSWYTPGVGGLFALLGLLIAGALLGNVATMLAIKLLGQEAGTEYATLISYPLMFIPPMIWAHNKSISNRFMSEPGYAIDSRHFSPFKGWVLALMCILVTLAGSLAMDPIGLAMPEMPAWLEEALNQMTQGNFILNFICVSIMAPFFEEWLCRGMVLRGLLNYSRIGSEQRGMHPATAIVISALFFAFIHLNPWQAIPAFLMGVVFGYVYYKTGSLKLTMLMHFTNNTFALILGQSELGEVESFYELMPKGLYIVTILTAILLIVLFFNSLRKIQNESRQGNCKVLPVEDEIQA